MKAKNTDVKFNKKNKAGEEAKYVKLMVPRKWVTKLGVTPAKPGVSLVYDEDGPFDLPSKRALIILPQAEGRSLRCGLLASKRRIHNFALTWMNLFKAHNTINEDFFYDGILGHSLCELGFDMDCLHSFCETFPGIRDDDPEDLKKVKDRITDVKFLGTAIYSQWRYWTHWAYGPMEEKDYQWFIIAFERLAELTDEN